MLTRVAVGLATFIVPQAVLFRTTSQPARPIEDPGWFLNGGVNVATIACVIAIVAAVFAARRRWRVRETSAFGFGVLVAMAGTLFAIGPGTLFPIVIVVGALVIGVAILVGTAVGSVVRLASTRVQLARR